jgi:hypothetical protein
VIHPSTIILAAVMECMEIITDNETCFVDGITVDELIEFATISYVDFVEGVLSPAIYIDDIKDYLLSVLKDYDDKKIYLGFENFTANDDPHTKPQEVNPLLIVAKKEKGVCGLVCDDQFYYSISTFNVIPKTGIFSLLFEAYIKGIISAERLLEITKKLSAINYHNLFSRNIMFELLRQADDKYIAQIIDICNAQL